MTPLHTAVTNVVFKGEGYDDLPAFRSEGDGIVIFFSLDEEERAAVAAGMPVKLSLLAHSPPPLKVEVGCE